MANEWELPDGFVVVRQPPAGPVEDIGRSIAPTVLRSITGLVGAPVDMTNLGLRAGTAAANWLSGRITPGQGQPPVEWPQMQAPQIPWGGSQTFQDMATSPTMLQGGARMMGASPEQAAAAEPGLRDALTYQAQTTPGKLTSDALEIALAAALPAAALGGSPGTVGRMATIGGGAGVVGEGADAVARRLGAGDATRSLVRAGTTLGAAIFGNRSLASSANSARMLRERVQGISPADMAAARAAEQRAVEHGVPLFGGEPLGRQGAGVQALTSDVGVSPQGAPINNAFGARQGQVQEAVAGPVRQPAGPGQPGNYGFLERVSPDATVEGPMAARTAATSPRFTAAGQQPVDPLQLQQFIGELDRAIASNGPATALGRELTTYRRSLLQNMGAGSEGITPTTNPTIGPLYQQYKDWRRGLNPDTPPSQLTDAQREARGVVRPLNTELRDTLRNASTTQAQAMDDYAAMSPRVQAAETRADYATRFDNALQSGGSRLDNPTVGARFAQDVRGRTGPGSERSPQFDETIGQAADARGNLRDSAITSANNFMDNLAFTNQIPGAGSRTAPRGAIAEEAGRNIVNTLAEALNVTRGAVLSSARTLSTGATRGNTYATLAEVLASPNGTERIMSLLSRSPNNQLTQIGAGNLAAAIAAARAGEQPRRP